MNMKKTLQLVLLAICGLSTSGANAAIALDRTRVIFPGQSNSVSVKVNNYNQDLPYLAQAWLEDANGNKINSPFAVLPPIQRVEPDATAMIQIRALPAAAQLPQDKESLFYFNVREVPPKSDEANVLQLALQTKVKFFYRPQALVVPTGSNKAPWQEQLTLTPEGGSYRIDNPTPYFITLVEAATSSNAEALDGFQSVMLAPNSSSTLKLDRKVLGATPSLSYIDDFGGRRQLNYHCGANCQLLPAK
ncbi:fimbria/pilus periplasmic chaperone [Aeromonas sp. HMWF014]|uniref:fimbria/pilus periplasmic chaperone n=1 Tax=Aeromonas sp. HMWF014 TaxID=2056850 RepID=UPI002159D22A|nr:fimbria/pilus periplasmic chaperone [Aeromonas sp. HMWF014]